MLDSSRISRSLDRKTTILWLELTDIFFLVTVCSGLNLLFARTGLKVYFVYLPTLILTTTLIAFKRGKPDGFLMHFLKFHLQPKHYSCFIRGQPEFSLTQALESKRRANQ